MSTAVASGPVHSGDHVVQFYESDADLVRQAGGYLLDGARDGAVSIVIASEAHRRAFEAQVDGTIVSLDAAETLARFTRGGCIDRDAFFEVIGTVVRDAAATGRPVRAFGEMVALLWEAGDVAGAIELETLWNELQGEVAFSLYCAYRSESVAGHEHAGSLERVCGLHSAVVPEAPVDATWRFPAEPAAAAHARRRLTEAVRELGHRRELLEDARLVVSELAANAIEHARSPFTVSIRCDASRLRIEVRDGDRTLPTLREETQTLPTGRGLRLVEALSSRWGVTPLPDGKAVWAELRA